MYCLVCLLYYYNVCSLLFFSFFLYPHEDNYGMHCVYYRAWQGGRDGSCTLLFKK